MLTLRKNINSMVIERPPIIKKEELFRAIISLHDRQIEEIVERINDSFNYWDAVKYKKCPVGYTPKQLWTLVKVSRLKNSMKVWGKYGVNLSLTNMMQKMCHEFDMSFGGRWGSDSTIDPNNKEQYLVSSLMEEAIYSSQMEGAATTRKVAKEMLKKKMTPRDKSHNDSILCIVSWYVLRNLPVVAQPRDFVTHKDDSKYVHNRLLEDAACQSTYSSSSSSHQSSSLIGQICSSSYPLSVSIQ